MTAISLTLALALTASLALAIGWWAVPIGFALGWMVGEVA